MGRAAQYAEGAGRKLEKQRSLLVKGVTNAILSIYVHILFYGFASLSTRSFRKVFGERDIHGF